MLNFNYLQWEFCEHFSIDPKGIFNQCKRNTSVKFWEKNDILLGIFFPNWRWRIFHGNLENYSSYCLIFCTGYIKKLCSIVKICHQTGWCNNLFIQIAFCVNFVMRAFKVPSHIAFFGKGYSFTTYFHGYWGQWKRVFVQSSLKSRT